MGYIPPQPPLRLNLDRHGMPRDYATYVWLLYGRRVKDESPQRRAFRVLESDGDEVEARLSVEAARAVAVSLIEAVAKVEER